MLDFNIVEITTKGGVHRNARFPFDFFFLFCFSK